MEQNDECVIRVQALLLGDACHVLILYQVPPVVYPAQASLSDHVLPSSSNNRKSSSHRSVHVTAPHLKTIKVVE